MTTLLQGPLKREIHIAGQAYTLTLSPEGMHLARKDHRKGRQLSWVGLLNDGATVTASRSAGLEGGSRNEQGQEGGDDVDADPATGSSAAC